MTATTPNQIDVTDLATRDLTGAVLEATARAVSALLNARFPHYPPLSWSAAVRPGWVVTSLTGLAGVTGHAEDDAPTVAACWAGVLGLGEPEHIGSYGSYGTVSYRGSLDGLPVTVWAITNPDTVSPGGDRA